MSKYFQQSEVIIKRQNSKNKNKFRLQKISLVFLWYTVYIVTVKSDLTKE